MTNNKYDYFIVGDFEVCGKVIPCLIELAGTTEEYANKKLEKVIANPPERCFGNIHIEKEEKENCWWNDKKDN